MSAPLLTPAELFLVIKSGPDKGTAYKLMGKPITLGRADENQVVLDDPKSSRQHAKITFSNGRYNISDLGSQNGILLNGQRIRNGHINAGDILVVGNTTIQVAAPKKSKTDKSQNHGPLVKASNNISQAGPGIADRINKPSFSSSKKGSAPDQRVTIGAGFVILLVAFMVFNKKSKSTSKEFEITDEMVVQKELESISKVNKEKQEEILRKGKNTPRYNEAQAFYKRGFREFREGNYSRAVENFNAALALFPSHKLAKRYLDRSRLRYQKQVTDAIARAERAFELQKYREAESEYKTVKLLVRDPNNETYQLAEKRLEAITLIRTSNK